MKPWNAMTSPVYESLENFENLKFDPFKSTLTKTSITTFGPLTRNIISHQRFYPYLKGFTQIRKIFQWFIFASAKKKFVNFKDFLSQTGSFFSVLCLTETWFDFRNSESSLYQLSKYIASHQHKSPSHKSGRGRWGWHKHVDPWLIEF